LQGTRRSITQESGERCTGRADLQPISLKSDRLPDFGKVDSPHR